jgi:two-component system secretion response regulator SsrB
MRVLLVDDDLRMRQALTALLRAIPGVVILGEAADGRFAVALTRAMAPDLVLVDLDLPVMTGLDATRTIRVDCPGVGVIGLAMKQSAERVQAMLDAGALACVTSAAVLPALLSALLRRRPSTTAHPTQRQ